MALQSGTELRDTIHGAVEIIISVQRSMTGTRDNLFPTMTLNSLIGPHYRWRRRNTVMVKVSTSNGIANHAPDTRLTTPGIGLDYMVRWSSSDCLWSGQEMF